MPEFIPEHTPNRLDEFTTGYLDAVEWLLSKYDSEGNEIPDDQWRDKLRGFTKKAIKQAVDDCRDFQAAMADQLAAWYLLGEDPARAGHDFFLTRNHHGAGFWDRYYNEPGNKLGDELSDCAHGYGEANGDVYRGWIHLM